jgi:hypothetical protein
LDSALLPGVTFQNGESFVERREQAETMLRPLAELETPRLGASITASKAPTQS